MLLLFVVTWRVGPLLVFRNLEEGWKTGNATGCQLLPMSHPRTVLVKRENDDEAIDTLVHKTQTYLVLERDDCPRSWRVGPLRVRKTRSNVELLSVRKLALQSA